VTGPRDRALGRAATVLRAELGLPARGRLPKRSKWSYVAKEAYEEALWKIHDGKRPAIAALKKILRAEGVL
jgi:hypothetical protein